MENSLTRFNEAARQLNIPVATLRDIRFKSTDRISSNGSIVAGNGFATAFVTLGRALYVDIPVFLTIWRMQGTQQNLTHALPLGRSQ